MEKFLSKADKVTKSAFCIILILFAVISIIGKSLEPVGTVAHAVTKASFIGNKAETTEEPTAISLGEFRITVYTPYCDGGVWGYQTATGVKSEGLKTCAVDPSVIPLGTTLLVDDICLKAVDTGSAVKGNVIDIFYDGTKEEATEWLSQIGTVHEVYEVTK